MPRYSVMENGSIGITVEYLVTADSPEEAARKVRQDMLDATEVVEEHLDWGSYNFKSMTVCDQKGDTEYLFIDSE